MRDNETYPKTMDRDANLPVDCPQPFRLLLEALKESRIRHCHWKSNIRLEESLRGKEDLDLLVDRAEEEAFYQIVQQSGFKLAQSASNCGHPGVFHAFALDEAGARLLHLHAYFQVVTGDSVVKAYRFPIEADLLDSNCQKLGVPVPTPEAELALFVLRMALKHTSVLELALVARGYQSVVDELMVLQAAADRDAAAALWCRWVPDSNPEMFNDALRAIGDPRALGQRITAGLRVASRVRGNRRMGALAVIVERWRRAGLMVHHRLLDRRNARPMDGGAVIALVGPKASGKSTLGGRLTRTFGRHLDVRHVHLGKPPATLLTMLPRAAIPLARKVFPGERSGEYEKPERRASGSYSLLHVLNMTMLAYDRRALLKRCAAAAASGAIVVTDRYPSKTVGAIDSSRFDDASLSACRPGLKRWLMEREQALYRGLPEPDLVIRLNVTPALAVARDEQRVKEDGPDASAVLRRWEMETLGSFGDVPVVEIDTRASLGESVVLLVKEAWAVIRPAMTPA